jgi:hypothetical protein
MRAVFNMARLRGPIARRANGKMVGRMSGLRYFPWPGNVLPIATGGHSTAWLGARPPAHE